MKTLNHQKRCDAPLARRQLFHLNNTWLQPGAISNETHQPFQRLLFESKTVETVSLFSFADIGLKAAVNEKTACIFNAL
jgi:hypothetical protein